MKALRNKSSPAIARLRRWRYEQYPGRRRKHACELAGIDTMPVIVRDLDRNAATIIMVDSNLQRETILEKSKSIQMKLEAIRLVGLQRIMCLKLRRIYALTIIAQQAGESRSNPSLYTLAELEPELQQMVDDGRIVMTPAVEYSSARRTKFLIDTPTANKQPLFTSATHEEAVPRGKLNDTA